MDKLQLHARQPSAEPPQYPIILMGAVDLCVLALNAVDNSPYL